MEEAFRNGLLDSKPIAKSSKDSGLKREDVDLLVSTPSPFLGHSKFLTFTAGAGTRTLTCTS